MREHQPAPTWVLLAAIAVALVVILIAVGLAS